MIAAHTMRRRGRVSTTLGLALVALVALAAPASADPAGPTNYSSVVLEVAPAVDGLEVEVLGGDAFLQVRNDGHEVLVPGYTEGEQYLRFDPDGTVWVNVRSATHWQNAARYSIQDSEIPADAGPDQPPRWEQVSDDGTYAWHDHRIHWMSPSSLPGEIDPTSSESQVAFDWPVTLQVDGEVVEVTGRLTWVPSVSPLLAILAALATLGLGAALLLTRGPAATVAVLVGVGVLLAGLVAASGALGLPAGIQGEPLPLVLTGVGVLMALAGLSARRRSPAGVAVAGMAGIPLLVWAATQSGAITAPIVPPAVLPAALVRVAVGVAAGAGLGAIAAGLRDLFSSPLTGAPAMPRSG